MKITKSYFPILILICISFQSCFKAIKEASAKNIPISKAGGQIPPDFGYSKDTLLVYNNLSGFTFGVKGKIRNSFADNYRGAYKIIKAKDLDKYNVTKYRFSFSIFYSGSYTSYGGGPGGTSKSTPLVACSIMDRQTNKEYKTDNHAHYGKLMVNCILKLNAELK